jgi:hypothetical protein
MPSEAEIEAGRSEKAEKMEYFNVRHAARAATTVRTSSEGLK